jgi:3',5'-cyclic AMP phosphodiesterase CpdA
MCRSRAPFLLLAAAILATTAAPVAADPAGRTTLEESIGLTPRSGVQVPMPAPGAPFEVHAAGGVMPDPARASRRRSLTFFAQLTDAQLADEMSPARLEFLRSAGAFGGAWRPHEALGPQTFDQAVRNVNANAVSAVRDGAGGRAALGFAIVTGDLSDNHQHNEVRWGVSILEGGRVDPFSGRRVGPGNRCRGASREAVRRLNAAVASRRYTGVQDYDDYPQRPATAYANFYDPDTAPVGGPHSALPRYPGLMERAQRPFHAAGLHIPWFAARGNHDALAQGFYAARGGTRIATGCRKVLPPRRLGPTGGRHWETMRGLLRRREGFSWVPPDPARRFMSPAGFKRLHRGPDGGHGFGMVDRRELRRSAGAASYYAWSPSAGVRFVSLDTVGEGGGSHGNLDHPQYLWLRRQLVDARRRGELVVVYGHHTLETMANSRPDERAGRCGPAKLACDADPRVSGPVHRGLSGHASLHDLLLRFPNVIAFVNGHLHRNRAVHFAQADGAGGFWQVTTASHLSFPQQTRLIELTENGDGSLSIFATALDTAAPAGVPAPGTAASGLADVQLASISRMLAANGRGVVVPAAAAARGSAITAGNVELLLPDPRL